MFLLSVSGSIKGKFGTGWNSDLVASRPVLTGALGEGGLLLLRGVAADWHDSRPSARDMPRSRGFGSSWSSALRLFELLPPVSASHIVGV